MLEVGTLELSVPFATVNGTGAWQPTARLPFFANYAAMLTASGTIPVRFEYTAVAGSWNLDDFYVDPLKHL